MSWRVPATNSRRLRSRLLAARRRQHATERSKLDRDKAPEFAELLPEQTGYDVPEIARAANAAFAATGLDGSAFDTPYCDETLRISSGGNPLRGELRVFTCGAAGCAVSGGGRRGPP